MLFSVSYIFTQWSWQLSSELIFFSNSCHIETQRFSVDAIFPFIKSTLLIYIPTCLYLWTQMYIYIDIDMHKVYTYQNSHARCCAFLRIISNHVTPKPSYCRTAYMHAYVHTCYAYIDKGLYRYTYIDTQIHTCICTYILTC